MTTTLNHTPFGLMVHVPRLHIYESSMSEAYLWNSADHREEPFVIEGSANGTLRIRIPKGSRLKVEVVREDES